MSCEGQVRVMLAAADHAGWESVSATPFTAVVAAVAALLVIHLVRSARRRMPVVTAPRRAFSVAERREGLARAGGRCEYKHPLWRRCRQMAAHADHVYPWSRGGWTSPSNLQMLCQRHNLVKGAKLLRGCTCGGCAAGGVATSRRGRTAGSTGEGVAPAEPAHGPGVPDRTRTLHDQTRLAPGRRRRPQPVCRATQPETGRLPHPPVPDARPPPAAGLAQPRPRCVAPGADRPIRSHLGDRLAARGQRLHRAEDRAAGAAE